MNLTLIFPCDFFDNYKVDESYRAEYEIAESIGFKTALFNHDLFVQEGKVKIAYNELGTDRRRLFLYRGWMLKAEEYEKLYWSFIKDYSIILLTSPAEYIRCHHFDHAYEYLRGRVDTPRTMVLDVMNSTVDYKYIRKEFPNGIFMKDNVKSVKGSDFPSKIDVRNVSEDEFYELIQKFIDFRGDLFTGKIVIKDYQELAQPANEYRAFYFKNTLLTVSKNSNQAENSEDAQTDLLLDNAIKNLDSPFYTVDFAKTADGRWIVIETGDGQVSGLSPNQNVLAFYTKLYNTMKLF